MTGLSTRTSISLGWALVAGRNRVPSPAAGKTALRTFAFINYSFYASRRIEWIESFGWIACRRWFYARNMRLEDRPVDRPKGTDVSLLQRVSRIVNSDLSLDEMLGQIVGLTGQICACDACIVYLLESATGDLVLRASQVPHRGTGSLRMRVGEGVTGLSLIH